LPAVSSYSGTTSSSFGQAFGMGVEGGKKTGSSARLLIELPDPFGKVQGILRPVSRVSDASCPATQI
jgi:hypothetical protein